MHKAVESRYTCWSADTVGIFPFLHNNNVLYTSIHGILSLVIYSTTNYTGFKFTYVH